NGNLEQTIKELEDAVKNGESSPGVIQRLAGLLTQRGRHVQAQTYLKQVRESLLVDSDLGRLDAHNLLKMGQTTRAAEPARPAVRAGTQDFNELVWLARVLAEAGRPAEARTKFDEAIAVSKGDPLPWVALVQFLAEQKRKGEARAQIDQAKAKLAGDR